MNPLLQMLMSGQGRQPPQVDPAQILAALRAVSSGAAQPFAPMAGPMADAMAGQGGVVGDVSQMLRGMPFASGLSPQDRLSVLSGAQEAMSGPQVAGNMALAEAIRRIRGGTAGDIANQQIAAIGDRRAGTAAALTPGYAGASTQGTPNSQLDAGAILGPRRSTDVRPEDRSENQQGRTIEEVLSGAASRGVEMQERDGDTRYGRPERPRLDSNTTSSGKMVSSASGYTDDQLRRLLAIKSRMEDRMAVKRAGGDPDSVQQLVDTGRKTETGQPLVGYGVPPSTGSAYGDLVQNGGGILGALFGGDPTSDLGMGADNRQLVEQHRQETLQRKYDGGGGGPGGGVNVDALIAKYGPAGVVIARDLIEQQGNHAEAERQRAFELRKQAESLAAAGDMQGAKQAFEAAQAAEDRAIQRARLEADAAAKREDQDIARAGLDIDRLRAETEAATGEAQLPPGITGRESTPAESAAAARDLTPENIGVVIDSLMSQGLTRDELRKEAMRQGITEEKLRDYITANTDDWSVVIPDWVNNYSKYHPGLWGPRAIAELLVDPDPRSEADRRNRAVERARAIAEAMGFGI